jgi:hypothetical protein
VRQIIKAGLDALFFIRENCLAGRAIADKDANPSGFTGLGSGFAAAHRMVARFVDSPTVNQSN